MDKLDHTYTLPTGITTVTNEMLDEVRDQDHIKHIIIPQGVTSIEEETFIDCSHDEVGQKVFLWFLHYY